MLIYLIVTEFVYILVSPILHIIFSRIPDAYRLGVYYPRKQYDVLVFAASMGEINGIKQLLLELSETQKNLKILLLTNTKTGYSIGKNLNIRVDVVISPLDLFHNRIMQLKVNRPRLILIAETEIWPMLLYAASIYKIPVVFINARMSLTTYKRFSCFKSFLAVAAKSVTKVCAQTDEDNERFSSFFSCDCETMGNLKYSIKLPEYKEDIERSKYGYTPNDRIIVLGSSRPGEEELLLQCYLKLKDKIKGLKLVIVPRHLKRISEIKKIFASENVSYESEASTATDIHVIDKIGLLPLFYSICDIAVIGGSFYPFGGHNPLEAAYYRKKIIIGPYHSACHGSVEELKKAEAIKVSNKTTLCDDIMILLEDVSSQMGDRAQMVMNIHMASLNRHLNVISGYLN
jgi:3-deoxy-D-manno-octulosonic-acid transferase